jgi:hypothetical protein
MKDLPLKNSKFSWGDMGPYIYTWATRFLKLGAQMATAYKS